MIPSRLFVLEMANNHGGSLDRGLRMIQEFAAVCKQFQFAFAFKLQYRDLPTFIHPAAGDTKYVRRFRDTALRQGDFDTLVAMMRSSGFLAMATPFDEPSVDLIERQNLDIIKVASCSFTDWPLWERIALTDKPIIASTAGATVAEIDKVVRFLTHRHKEFALMHCVGEYPTPADRMSLDRIDMLRERYPGVRIGLSTHEPPENMDLIKLAVAKGCTIFEKHVCVGESNGYSANSTQIAIWLHEASKAWTMCVPRTDNAQELESLNSLKRGIFAKRFIARGTQLSPDDVYFAFPAAGLLASDWSRYSVYTATEDILADAPITITNTNQANTHKQLSDIAAGVRKLLQAANITVPADTPMEISHHYGLDKFYTFGLTMLTVVNREYCKKLLVLLPGQEHPEQFHTKKEETFHVLHGDVGLFLNSERNDLRAGNVITIMPGIRHSFVSSRGAVIEEISSTHHANDSFYTDESINANKNRKTLLPYWIE